MLRLQAIEGMVESFIQFPLCKVVHHSERHNVQEKLHEASDISCIRGVPFFQDPPLYPCTPPGAKKDLKEVTAEEPLRTNRTLSDFLIESLGEKCSAGSKEFKDICISL